MSSKILFISVLILTFFNHTLFAETLNVKKLSGSWHLRALDGNEVRKARAILEFDGQSMKISGFDGCNSINGLLTLDPQTKNYHSSALRTTRMACRGNIQRYVHQKIHNTLESSFIIRKEKKYGIEGITIKSSKHSLFFKRMGKDSWF